MNEQESVILAESYFDLQDNYSMANVNAFLRACWLLPEDQKLTAISFERLIYIEGDQQEIYTYRERNLIKSVNDDAYSCGFQLSTKSGPIKSRITAIDLADSSNSFLDALAIMKIHNKAIDGFNLFLFVSKDAIYLGCSSLHSSNSEIDCVISPPINFAIDWEQMSYIFLLRDDSEYFYQYYRGLVSAFIGVGYCYRKEDQTSYDWDSYARDDCPNYYDIYERIRRGEPFENRYNIDEQPEFDEEVFEREVRNFLRELSYIEKTHTNPLELLFEAEEALAMAEIQDTEANSRISVQSDDTLPNVELLDDPIALMKKLKRDRGV